MIKNKRIKKVTSSKCGSTYNRFVTVNTSMYLLMSHRQEFMMTTSGWGSLDRSDKMDSM